MCSVYGAYGAPSPARIQLLSAAAQSRGRDGGRHEWYRLSPRAVAVLGNHRAAPTPERFKDAPLQPYLKMIHNGTVANDKELGAQEGEVDSQALARYIDRSSLLAFRDSLQRVRGSYAIACVARHSLFLACNYKPIHIYYDEPGLTTYFSSLAAHLRPLIPSPYLAPVRMKPYSVLDLATGATLSLERRFSRRAVVLASAGLDSTTAAALLKEEGWEVLLLHIRYGCRAEDSESSRIPLIAAALGCDFLLLDLPMRYANSSLFDRALPIAEGVAGAEWAHEWVPARNLLFFSVAAAFAESHDYHAIALGNNLEEAGAYPDNEEQMTLLLDEVLDFAVHDGYELRALSPLGNLMKHEIVREGLRLGVPYDLTWSCYHSQSAPCNQCGPCFMRRVAFERNGTTDPLLQKQAA